MIGLLAFVGIIALLLAAYKFPTTTACILLAFVAYGQLGLLAFLAVAVGSVIIFFNKNDQMIAESYERYSREKKQGGSDY